LSQGKTGTKDEAVISKLALNVNEASKVTFNLRSMQTYNGVIQRPDSGVERTA
jgi:hypothetical protein